MFAQVAFLAALLALSHAGILLGGGLGLGSGIGIESGIGLGGLGLGGLGGGIIAKQGVVDLYAPPKYEYNYAVEDAHTADLKEQAESRIGDLTKSEYAVAEKDRATRVSRIIAGAVPLVSKGYY